MRRLTSLILAIAFVILAVSGIQMAGPQTIQPQGQVQSKVGGDKATAAREKPFYPKEAHELAGFVFIGAGLVHVGLNRRAMLAYLGNGKGNG